MPAVHCFCCLMVSFVCHRSASASPHSAVTAGLLVYALLSHCSVPCPTWRLTHIILPLLCHTQHIHSPDSPRLLVFLSCDSSSSGFCGVFYLNFISH